MFAGILELQPRAARAWFWRACFWFAALQLLILCYTPLNLAPDEAHYWEWSRHLDWAYYSKGPLMALLVRLGTMLFGATELGVRFGSWLCSFLLSIAFYFFAAEISSASIAFLAFIVFRSMLFFFSLGLVATTDPAAALFWVLTLWAAYRALFREQGWAWLLVGLFAGLGVLAKYTLLILPASIFLFVLCDTQARRHLRSRFLWIGVIVFIDCLLPILLWNANYNWVNFRHNAGHVYKSDKFFLQPQYLLELLGGQLGLMGPISAVLALVGLVWGWRKFRAGDRLAGLLFFSAAPLALLCVMVALTKRIYANWPMPLFLSALFLLVHLLATDEALRKKLLSWFSPALKLNVFLILISLGPLLGYSMGLPGKLLPTKRLVGWSELGRHVSEITPAGAFLLTDAYGDASEISFYSSGQPFVYVANTDGRRMNQYDIWGGWGALVGRDALIIVKNPAAAETLREHFAQISEIPSSQLPIEFGGQLQRTFYFFEGRGFDGRPAQPSGNF